jgi:hypothetical protein
MNVLSHEYHLHWDLGATIRDYQLWDFLQKGSIEPKPEPKLAPPPSAAQNWSCGDGKDGLAIWSWLLWQRGQTIWSWLI